MTILKTDTVSGIGTEGTVFEGDITFDSLNYMTLPKGTTTQSNRGRAVFFGGYQGSNPAAGVTNIDYLNIQSGGISQSFGTLLENRRFDAGLASATRGVTGGSDGQPSWATGTMEYVTIATTSNSTTFGNMTASGGMVSACSNNTRGIYFSVWDSSPTSPVHKKHIDYITIATAANSQDFGELSAARPEAGGFGSPTRGICAGGYDALSPNNPQDTIDYVTIASTGNATDFGNLTVARQAPGSTSSSTRGVITGGYAHPAWQNTIDYVTIATTGNATDFGDLVTALYGQFVGNCSDKIRGVFAGGKISAPTYSNSIEYVNIASTGNSVDWGDIVRGTSGYGSTYGSICSDSHGGLSE